MIRNTTAIRAVLGCLLLLGASLLRGTGPVQAENRRMDRALLLLKSTSAQGSAATFGRQATENAASRAIKEPFARLGVQFVSASGLNPRVGEADEGLPLSDDAAMDMARQAGAGISVVVGIEVRASGKIRATGLLSHQVLLHLRVLDVAAGEVVFDKSVRTFGYHESLDQGARLAVARAIIEAGEGLLPKLLARWPEDWKANGAASMTLTVTGANSWRPLAAILQRLAATKGVEFVHALEIQSSHVRLSVSSRQSIASLIASLRRTRIYKGTLSVSASGNSIAISLQMNAPGSPVNHG